MRTQPFYDGNRRLFNRRGSFKTLAHFDSENPADLILEEVQDCEPLVERCKVLSDETPGKDFRHVAIVPRVIMNQAYREGWADDEDQWRKWLNDPDNRAFRTWQGRV